MSRISPGTLLLGVASIAFGLLAAYVVRQNMRQAQPTAEQPEVKITVVPMSGSDLKAGRKITLGDVALQRLTPEQMKRKGVAGVFMSNPQQIIGRVLRQDLSQGSAFDSTMFYPEGVGPSVVERLQPGLRAVTLSVENDGAVAGFARPGAWVDVYFRNDNQQEAEREKLPETTITLLENVEILALDRETFEGAQSSEQRGRTQPVSVTLAVAPQEAVMLQVVQERGTLSLGLRHPEEKTRQVSHSKPQTLGQLFNFPEPDTYRMEVYRGNRLSEIEFERTKPQLSPQHDLYVRTREQRSRRFNDARSPAEPEDPRRPSYRMTKGD